MDHRMGPVIIPGVPDEEMPGKLIVLEGTDGVGRSTQMRLLRNWLESSGLAVYDTGLTRGRLAGSHIQQAKEGHTMGRRTQALFYATDFADRLEREIIPAMRAGYVVLTDRYVYSLMARAAVRGMEPEWVRKLYAFAPTPDVVLYLRITLGKLVPRVLASGGFDYWESGMDYRREATLYSAFVKHQAALLEQFEQLAQEHEFRVVNAEQPIRKVFDDLQEHVTDVVSEMVEAHQMSDFVAPAMPQPPAVQHDRSEVAESLRDLLSSLLEDGSAEDRSAEKGT
ncbi:MAG TPA: dTMP kinase [Armatimonadetes bacterium]|nr:dTMP kinase [Armatimonadota bacterium]